MEIKQLLPFVLTIIFVGMLLGIGLLIFDNFGRVGRDATTITVHETFNASDGSWVDLAQSTITGSTATFYNATGTNSMLSSYFEFDSDILYGADKVKLTAAGQAIAGLNNSNVNVTYTYGATSATTTTVGAVSTATAAIGNTWLALIVTVVVLAIILTLVIRSFSQQR